MKLLKETSKGLFKGIVSTTSSIIDGADEALNGDDIKQVRDEKRKRYEAYRESIRQYEMKKSSVSVAALLLFFGMIAYTMIEKGFNNQLVNNLVETHGIALFFPFVMLAIALIVLDHFFKPTL